MEAMRLDNGLEVDVKVVAGHGGGYMILHRSAEDRGKKTYTITCCCDGQCKSIRCTYDGDEVPSPMCDCTGSSPSVSCA